MDSWILKGVKHLVNEPTTVNITSPTQVKIKVTHLMLTDFDEVVFNGGFDISYPRIPGRAAVGIVMETGENCYGLEKGTRVYFEPTRPCGGCLACKSGKPKECSNIINAGKDFDGFMRDFVVCEYNEVAPPPRFRKRFSGALYRNDRYCGKYLRQTTSFCGSESGDNRRGLHGQYYRAGIAVPQNYTHHHRQQRL